MKFEKMEIDFQDLLPENYQDLIGENFAKIGAMSVGEIPIREESGGNIRRQVFLPQKLHLNFPFKG